MEFEDIIENLISDNQSATEIFYSMLRNLKSLSKEDRINYFGYEKKPHFDSLAKEEKAYLTAMIEFFTITQRLNLRNG